jgi:hypothetical protein
VDLIKRENPSIVDGSMAEDWRKEYIEWEGEEID